ncbi:hypothetical protein IFJ82_01120 [Novacetimonas hansenii]|uniref:ATP synthase subunit b n=2 Tax=Novacetimonas hansenii TaxID=436 RepID=A0AAW5ES48_NOVHA|nr:ATP synthase F0 subunit B' [Novacetimonas hansenii]EFG86042.1 H+transporting two-sector ATPase B/B' subunit [Novacetimonas hansenii ATCC 23769]MBL7237577.1 hypothetical protein [Novacetimonas hansenii]MCJ8354125.1 hypothetical protein [Novacetimonas hansenii]PYD73723.1 hypothetical protein CFR74_01850 [Novacetimonas hansenii]QOF95354.1 hypothetical protein IFJ82_01120 [Novacetimonas hansenii]
MVRSTVYKNIRRVASRAAAPVLALPLMAMVAPGARAEGMPQLDFGNPYVIGQVVWGAGIFLILYLLLSRSALPKVEKVLSLRRQTIENDLEIAHKAKSRADDAVAELRQARKDAMAEAQANVDKVVEEARAAAEKQAQEMNTRLGAEIREAEARVALARETALGSLRQISTDTAEALIHQISGISAPLDVVTSKVDGVATARGF